MPLDWLFTLFFLQAVLPFEMRDPSDLTVVEDKLYWTERRSNKIISADKFIGKRREKVIRGQFEITSMVAMHPQLQPEGTRTTHVPCVPWQLVVVRCRHCCYL